MISIITLATASFLGRIHLEIGQVITVLKKGLNHTPTWSGHHGPSHVSWSNTIDTWTGNLQFFDIRDSLNECES